MKINKQTVENFVKEVNEGKKNIEEVKNLPLAELVNLISILKTFSQEMVGKILEIAEKYQRIKKTYFGNMSSS